MSLVNKSLTGLPSLRRIQKSDLADDPEVYLLTQTSNTRLDWVGRNHGRKVLVKGKDMRKTNFLYVDGHIETKTIYETLDPVFEWGEQFYSLNPGFGHSEVGSEKQGRDDSGEQRCSPGGDFLSRHGRVGG